MPLISKTENVGLVFSDSTIINEDVKVLEKSKLDTVKSPSKEKSAVTKKIKPVKK